MPAGHARRTVGTATDHPCCGTHLAFGRLPLIVGRLNTTPSGVGLRPPPAGPRPHDDQRCTMSTHSQRPGPRVLATAAIAGACLAAMLGAVPGPAQAASTATARVEAGTLQ